MSFEILQYPRDALLLRRKARAVRDDEFGTEAFLAFVDRLGQTMMNLRGYGLASTQVEEHPGGEPWAVFVMRVDNKTWGAVCNPTILGKGEPTIATEACLSFASVPEAMSAPADVMVHGFNSQGAGFTVVWADKLARCAFHECEHLQGRTMIDRMSPMKKALFLKRVAKARGRR